MPDYEKPRDFFRGKVIPLYAECVGERLSLKEALLLQQLHYWLKANEQNPDHIWDGHVWAWNSLSDWAKEVPVGGEKTNSRLFDHLVEMGLVLAGQHGGHDRRKSYTIVYAEAEKLSYGQNVRMMRTICLHQADNLSACNRTTCLHVSKKEITQRSHKESAADY